MANPDIANPDIANPDIANPDIANPDIANPDIANPDIANASLSDITWTMTNDGNTTAAFNVNLFLSQQTTAVCAAGQDPKTDGCIATQLILRKVYNTPVATGCSLEVQSQNVLLVNIKNPQFVMPGQGLPDQNSDSPANATLWLAPGESAKITLRVYDPVKAGNVPVADSDPSTPTPGGSFIDPVFLPTTTTTLGSVTPVVQQQSVDTEDIRTAAMAGAPPPTPPIVTPLSPRVPFGEGDDPKPTPLSLAFVQQPSAVYAGAPFSTTVKVLDQYGKLLPNAPVKLFIGTNPNPPGTPVTLTGNTATTGADGIASFSAVSIVPAAVGYTLVATSGQALPAVSGTFVVAPRPATVTLGNLTQIYSGETLAPAVLTDPPGLSVSLVFLQNGNPAVPRNAGAYTVAATIVDPLYQGGSQPTTFTILKATPVITWAPAPITQGQALGASQLNATANVPGAPFVYDPPAGTVMNTVGAQTLSATFTPVDALNYNTATATATVDVLVAPPTSDYTEWSGSGTGVVTVPDNGSTGTPRMQYEASPGNGFPASSGNWEFSTVSVNLRTVNLSWAWKGDHSWYMVTAGLDAFVRRNGVDVFTARLVSLGPVSCCAGAPSGGFSFSGATTVSVQAGDTYGFRLRGSHADSALTLRGTFSVGVGAPTPANFWHADGTGIDSVGGVDATLMNGASFAAGQQGFGQAFSLANPQVSLTPTCDPDNPPAFKNQYVGFGASAAFEPDQAVDHLSFGAWIFPTGPGSGVHAPDPDGVLEGGIIVNKEDDYEVARFADGSIRWAFSTSGDPGWAWVNTGAFAPLLRWTHVVVTFDAGVIKTYVNGALAHTYNGTGADISNHLQGFRIGGRQQFDGDPCAKQNFNGQIDDVMFFKRALTASEVLQSFLRRY